MWEACLLSARRISPHAGAESHSHTQAAAWERAFPKAPVILSPCAHKLPSFWPQMLKTSLSCETWDVWVGGAEWKQMLSVESDFVVFQIRKHVFVMRNTNV